MGEHVKSKGGTASSETQMNSLLITAITQLFLLAENYYQSQIWELIFATGFV